jgi:hypothetical protein
MAKSSDTSLGTRSSDLVRSSSNSPVSGALCGYFWHVRKDRVRIPSAIQDYSLTGMRFLRKRITAYAGCPVVKETSYFHLETTVQVRKACRSKGPTGRRRRLEAQGSAERLLRYSSRLFPGTRISLQQNNSGRWRREQLLRSTRGRRRFESCHEKQFSCG